MRVVIERHESSDEGTFGSLSVYENDGERPVLVCCSGELPNRGNKRNVSCIPVGIYKCGHHNSRKFPNTFIVHDVPNRSGILIHTGNYCGDRSKGFRSDVEGCILVGATIGRLSGQKAVLSSRQAMNYLRAFLGKSDFTLEIKEA